MDSKQIGHQGFSVSQFLPIFVQDEDRSVRHMVGGIHLGAGLPLPQSLVSFRRGAVHRDLIPPRHLRSPLFDAAVAHKDDGRIRMG